MFPRVVTIAPGEGARSRQVLPSSTATPFSQPSVVRRERLCLYPGVARVFYPPIVSLSLPACSSFPAPSFFPCDLLSRAPSIAHYFLIVCRCRSSRCFRERISPCFLRRGMNILLLAPIPAQFHPGSRGRMSLKEKIIRPEKASLKKVFMNALYTRYFAINILT